MTFSLAILSDLHAAPKSGSSGAMSDVKLFSDQEQMSPSEHPILGLKELIKTAGLTANAVVCPGDMTNKANGPALAYVWSNLHQIGSLLGASGVVATVGNHDVDSRGHSEGGFPREALMRLKPPFPASETRLSDKYWAHGYCFQVVGQARFLVINTCWLHEARDELERGVVSDYTIEQIADELKKPSASAFNIAVFHHHPHPHTDLKLGADDIIKNGQKLLDLLADHGQWLVVHGHKHHPKVEYAQGQYQQPIVLASGSFSGRLEGDNAAVSKNYFHLVQIQKFGSQLVGEMVSWQWIPGLGWRQYAASPPALPSRVGFGCRETPEALAMKVAGFIGSRASVEWSELVSNIPQLKFMMPKQFEALTILLDQQFSLRVLRDDYSLPKQLGPRLSNA
jgi:calcineurin-like phosphoesterase family protein